MDQEGEIRSDVYAEQYSQVRSFVQNLTYYQGLSSCTMPFEGEFFEAACDAFLGAATLAWCNVFVDCKSHVYWSRLIVNMPEKIKQDFENRVRKSANLTEEQYQEFQCSMKKLRDKCVAHIDRDWLVSVPYDLFLDKALRVAIQYEWWLKDMLRKEGDLTPGDTSFNDIVEGAKGDVDRLKTILVSQEQ